MSFRIYRTAGHECPILLTMDDVIDLPPHPNGGDWVWLLSSSEKPQNALIGRNLLRNLKKQGWAISESHFQDVIRTRLRG